MTSNKFYIPTSTLNFNNIMSSESISPAGFYSERKFGYKRFEKTEPNNLENRIVLYENYPIFNIDDEELENYPMIIEIDKKYIKEDIIQEHKNGVFYTEETIYFNPFSTKFYFRNENEKRSTLSKAEPSIESKMIALYQNCFEIQANNKVESFKWEQSEIKDSKSNPNHISKDRKINKLKGFMYAYILGSNKSFPAEVVTLKKYAKDLRNTLSALVASADGQPTYKQQEQLNAIYKAINDTFCKAEGLDKKIQIIREEYFKEGKFEEFLTKFGSLWLPKPTFQLSPFFVSSKADADEKEKALEQYISNLERTINRFSNPKLIKKEQFPILQHFKIESIPEQTKFVPKLLNEYLEEAYSSEDFIQSRYEFAKSGGKIFKEQIQKEWDGSEYQMYINTLLRNLNEYSQFEINSTENPTLKSFAAFCQKGESDIDKLEDYLISNKIGDFRTAFALWGAIFGFANMPKTLTNDLFLSSDLDYISEVYKYVFKQIHDVELNETFERKQEKEIKKFSSKINEQPKPEEKKGTSIKQEILEEKQNREKLKKAKIKDKQIDTVIDAWKENHFLMNEKLFIAISKIQGIGKATVEKIKDALSPNQQKPIQQQAPTLGFDFPLEKEFYLDDNAWSCIENLTYKSQKVKDKIKKNLKTIQEGYRPNGYYDKRGDAKDNKKVIEHFLVWNVSEKNNYNKLQQSDFPNETREEIRKILESKYPN